MTTLWNANPRSAYRAGFYAGTHTMDELLRHGDFGLGGLEANDGELVVLDGVAYRTAFDGTTHALPGDATTPFGTVLPFAAEQRFEVEGPLSKDAFFERLGSLLPLRNRMWALRVHGELDLVVAGASLPQSKPWRELPVVLEEYSRPRRERTRGTLVGFSSPDYLTGIDSLGLHFHWLSDDRSQGGHVFDLEVRRVVVEAAEAHAFAVEVAPHPDLLALDLTPRQ